MTKPTILQIVPELDTGGAELSAVEISAAVVQAGGRGLIATEGGRLEERALAQGSEIVRLPVATKNPLQMALNVRRLVELAKTEQISLMHARSRAPAWSVLRAARKSGIPFVTTYHGAYGEKTSLKRLYNSVMARGDVVIANSQFTANLIRQRYGTPEDRLRVIYRGVDQVFDRQQISRERRDSLRGNWQIPEGRRIVLQAARLTDWKGQSVLIAAAGKLAATGELGETIIVLAGDAQGRAGYKARLEREIEQLGLGGRVHMVGHVSDMAAAFALAHVSVVASIEPEAFGRAGAESQALGCPVIATRLGAPQETVMAEPDTPRDQITGWLVPPGDADQLADCLGEALALGDEEREAIGRRAIAHVRGNFTLEHMQRQTLDVYDDLLESAMADAFADAT